MPYLHTVVPAHLCEGLPAFVNPQEVKNLLDLPDFKHATFTEISDSYVRRLAKANQKDYKISTQGHVVSVARTGSPRGLTPLARLDAQLAWHAQRVADLARDRALVLAHEGRQERNLSRATEAASGAPALPPTPLHDALAAGAPGNPGGASGDGPATPANPWADLGVSVEAEG